MVGAGGFEPPNTGSKVPRLTAWPRPSGAFKASYKRLSVADLSFTGNSFDTLTTVAFALSMGKGASVASATFSASRATLFSTSALPLSLFDSLQDKETAGAVI